MITKKLSLTGVGKEIAVCVQDAVRQVQQIYLSQKIINFLKAGTPFKGQFNIVIKGGVGFQGKFCHLLCDL